MESYSICPLESGSFFIMRCFGLSSMFFFTYRSFSFVSEEDGLKGVLMLLHWLLKFSDDKGNCFRVLNTGLCVFKVQRDTAGKFPLYRCWVTQQAQLYERLSSSSPKRFTILFFH